MSEERCKFVYIGRKPECGCLIAFQCDSGDDDVQEVVMGFLQRGYVVERVENKDGMRLEGCDHCDRDSVSA